MCVYTPSPIRTYFPPHVLILLAFITGNSILVPLLEGLFISNPYWFKLTGFRPESKRGHAANPNLLSPALFSTELWWQMHHRRSCRTLILMFAFKYAYISSCIFLPFYRRLGFLIHMHIPNVFIQITYASPFYYLCACLQAYVLFQIPKAHVQFQHAPMSRSQLMYA